MCSLRTSQRSQSCQCQDRLVVLSCQCQDSGYDGAVTTTPPASNDARPYHHGDLPRALLEAAVQAIAEAGAAAVSLRELARRAGVSHAAPAHHFGDKAGLLTAVAADGFRRLAATLGDAYRATGSFLEGRAAYAPHGL